MKIGLNESTSAHNYVKNAWYITPPFIIRLRHLEPMDYPLNIIA